MTEAKPGDRYEPWMLTEREAACVRAIANRDPSALPALEEEIEEALAWFQVGNGNTREDMANRLAAALSAFRCEPQKG